MPSNHPVWWRAFHTNEVLPSHPFCVYLTTVLPRPSLNYSMAAAKCDPRYFCNIELYWLPKVTLTREDNLIHTPLAPFLSVCSVSPHPILLGLATPHPVLLCSALLPIQPFPKTTFPYSHPACLSPANSYPLLSPPLLPSRPPHSTLVPLYLVPSTNHSPHPIPTHYSKPHPAHSKNVWIISCKIRGLLFREM